MVGQLVQQHDSANPDAHSDDSYDDVSRRDYGHHLRLLVNDTVTANPDSLDINRDEIGCSPVNQASYGCYRMVHALLYHSFLELGRKSTQKAEAEFWRSRRADFYVGLYNDLREQIQQPPVDADRIRRGMAIKYKQPEDWLMPDDDMTPQEVECYCASYMQSCKSLLSAFPEGVPDVEADKQFTPNIKKALPEQAVVHPVKPSPREQMELACIACVLKSCANCMKAPQWQRMEMGQHGNGVQHYG